MANVVFDPQQVRVIVRDELVNLANIIKRQHTDAGQVASGRTRNSIRAEILQCDDAVTEGVLWGRGYFGTLETGRKAGKIPANFQQTIYEWMMFKGIKATPIGKQTQEQADKSLAFCIARKIAKSGTTLYRAGGRADIYSNVIPSAVERIGERVGLLFGSYIEDCIKLNT